LDHLEKSDRRAAIKQQLEFMPKLVPVLTKDEIEHVVAELARRISSDYRDRELVLIAVLKGAFIFLADLIRQLTIPVKVDFIRIASYFSNTSSSGEIQLTKEIEIDIKGKDVLIVEDIIDSGLTVDYILNYLKSFGPNTVKVCTLLDKTERRESDIQIDYAGHAAGKGFLVGYGLDYAEDYRYLPDVYDLIS
jgi:hypoxanthine phosphoribosyltransferase